jgi:hypothetical protein
VEGKDSPTYLPTAVDDLCIDLLVRQAETKHSLQYARYHEMVPKMMYVQQHTTTRSIKRQPTQLVDLDEQDNIIRLTHGAMSSRHRSSWLDDDVIWSAVAEIPLDQLG